MRCLDEATALSFALGELDPGSLEGVIEHISHCESCRVTVAAAAAGTAEGAGARVATPGQGPLPEQIGRFSIEGVAGHGAMGIVYRGFDERLERPVAVKLVHPELLGSDGQRRLEREARALAKVDHPAVVRVYEVGDVEGSLFVAMEYIDGGTLEAWLALEPRDPETILARFIQAGEGLLAAHRAGLVHRDFKPTNAMLDERGDVHVTDFGLVSEGRSELARRALDPEEFASTQAGAIIGTPAYMSPEQLQGQPVDSRSDQFSFCVALFEALAGHRPFEASTYPKLVDAVSSGRPLQPERAIDPRVHQALRRGLAPDSRDRFDSMRELLDELAPPESKGRSTWLGAVWISMAVLVVLALALVLTGTWPPDDEDPQGPEAPPDSAAPPPQPETPCTELSSRWDEVWNEARKQAIRDHVQNKWPAQPPERASAQAKANWEGLGRLDASFSVDGIRRFGETWRSLVDATCEGGSPTSGTAKLRRRCLADGLDRVEALIQNPPQNAKLRDALDEVSGTLPRCSTHLVASLSLPKDEAGELVEQARAELVEASAARWDMRFEDAVRQAQAAIDLGERAGDPTLLAEAWLEFGNSKAETRAPDGTRASQDAIDALHEALSFAQQSMHHRIIRETSDALAWEYAFGADDARQARRWVESASRLDAKIEPTDLELRRRTLIQARIARLDGEPELALAHLEGMLEHTLRPPIAQIVITEWALVLLHSEPNAIPAMLDQFEDRYPLEPAVLDAVVRVREITEEK